MLVILLCELAIGWPGESKHSHSSLALHANGIFDMQVSQNKARIMERSVKSAFKVLNIPRKAYQWIKSPFKVAKNEYHKHIGTKTVDQIANEVLSNEMKQRQGSQTWFLLETILAFGVGVFFVYSDVLFKQTQIQPPAIVLEIVQQQHLNATPFSTGPSQELILQLILGVFIVLLTLFLFYLYLQSNRAIKSRYIGKKRVRNYVYRQ